MIGECMFAEPHRRCTISATRARTIYSCTHNHITRTIYYTTSTHLPQLIVIHKMLYTLIIITNSGKSPIELIFFSVFLCREIRTVQDFSHFPRIFASIPGRYKTHLGNDSGTVLISERMRSPISRYL